MCTGASPPLAPVRKQSPHAAVHLSSHHHLGPHSDDLIVLAVHMHGWLAVSFMLPGVPPEVEPQAEPLSPLSHLRLPAVLAHAAYAQGSAEHMWQSEAGGCRCCCLAMASGGPCIQVPLHVTLAGPMNPSDPLSHSPRVLRRRRALNYKLKA